jgi:two-component system, NtrC family, response regulator HydG
MPKILLIDDDPTFCLMLSTFLKRQQYEVKTAYTAGEGLNQLKADTFDLILTDFRLPDKNGLELLEQIRVLDTKVPVILMTHYADIRTAVKAIKMGAFEYLAKPINPDETLLTIRKALTYGREGSVATKPVIPAQGGFTFVKGSQCAVGAVGGVHRPDRAYQHVGDHRGRERHRQGVCGPQDTPAQQAP